MKYRVYINNGYSKIRGLIIFGSVGLIVAGFKLGFSSFLDFSLYKEWFEKGENPLLVWYLGFFTAISILITLVLYYRKKNWIEFTDEKIIIVSTSSSNPSIVIELKRDEVKDITFQDTKIFFNLENRSVCVETDYPKRNEVEINQIFVPHK